MAMTEARTTAVTYKRPISLPTDALVLTAVTAVTVALGVGLYAQLGLTSGAAAACALAIHVALVALHALITRADAMSQLERENARLTDELEQLSLHGADGESGHGMPADPLMAARRHGLAALGPRPTQLGPELPAASGLVPYPAPTEWLAIPAPDRTAEAKARDRGFGRPAQHAPSATLPTAAERPGRRWEFGPAPSGLVAASATSSTMPSPSPATAKAEDLQIPPASSETFALGAGTRPAVPATDIDQIHNLIKKIAQDINTERSKSERPAVERAMPRREPEAVIARSLEALRATAATLREAAAAVDPSTVVPAAAPPADRTTDSDVVAQQRVSFFIEPILALPDHGARHYEVLMRIETETGETVDPTADTTVRAAGLLPVLDALKISCSARIAQRMQDRGKTNSLFSAIAAESLASDRLLADAQSDSAAGGTLYSRLVLTFTQAEVRTFSQRHWAVLKDMHGLGFRFALDEVTDLELDFEGLCAAGFAFAKLDAPVFLDGLPASAGHIPAADVCRHLADHGLTLIVGRIDDERQLARVLGFGVLFGQGALFGAPRPVKADLVGDRREAAA